VSVGLGLQFSKLELALVSPLGPTAQRPGLSTARSGNDSTRSRTAQAEIPLNQ